MADADDTPDRRRRRRGWPWAVLLGLAAVVVLARLHTRGEPLERDVAGYAVIGHEMLRGRALYADLWERKPPLLYATFAAAERLVGYGPGEVLAVNAAAALATLAACYAAGRAGAGPAGGLAAAGLWAVLGGDLHLQANQPNAEVFVNAALTAAVAVLVRPGRAAGLLVGGLFAVASLYEQHVVLTCAALAAATVAAAGRDGRRRRLADVAVAAAVGAVVWAGWAVYFAAVGRLGAATSVLFSQLFADVSLLANLRVGLRPAHLFPPFMIWAVLPAGLMATAAVRRPHATGPWVVWAGWVVGTWVMVAAPGWFFAHYYQLWLPPMCVAGGWAAASLVRPASEVSRTRASDAPRSGPSPSGTHRPDEGATSHDAGSAVACAFAARGGTRADAQATANGTANRTASSGPGLRRRRGPASVLVAFALALAYEAPNYRLTPDQWAAAKGAGDFAQQRRLAERLDRLLTPAERFWADGHDNSLYFYARRSPVTGLLYPDPLRYGPQARAYRDRLWRDLTAARPAVVLTRSVHLSGGDMPLPKLAAWLRDQYETVPSLTADCPDFVAHVRRDADLLQRLDAATSRPAG